MKNPKVTSSFRDPAGFVFKKDGILYRQVNKSFAQNFDLFTSSGLYKTLADKSLIISHTVVDAKKYRQSKAAYKVLRPKLIPFISYPYEWSFSQLKDAALTTLHIQRHALDHDMSMRDATAYNIQFTRGRPVLIDSLSFEKYEEGKPWVAYRQFCQHFLAPLALMSYVDLRLSRMLSTYIDGIPLDLASRLLPLRTRLNFATLSHIHLHARAEARYGQTRKKIRTPHLSKKGLLTIIDNLRSIISSLKLPSKKTQWADYYCDTNYSETAFRSKKRILEKYLRKVNPKMVWDMGANVGIFSRIAGKAGTSVVAFDIDPIAVEKNYMEAVKSGEKNILPLVLDLSNPSSAIGWAHCERMSLRERGPADLVMALALIHHLRISNNVPFERIAQFFAEIGRYIIVEFIPKNDSQVGRFLVTREDIFADYTQRVFKESFSRFFRLVKKDKVTDTKRVMYLMKRLS